MLQDKYKRTICKVFSTCPQVQRAVLFGSRAKGSARNGSDIDIALEGEGLDHSTLLALEEKIDNLFLPVKVDLLVLTDSVKEPLRNHIRRVGIEWYKNKPG